MMRTLGLAGLLAALLLAFCVADASAQEKGKKGKKGKGKGQDSKAQFERMDSNKDGFVDVKEYETAMKAFAEKFGEKIGKEKAQEFVTNAVKGYTDAVANIDGRRMNLEQFTEYQKKRFQGKKGGNKKPKDA